MQSNTEKIIIHTDDAPAAVGAYSQGVQVGNLLFISLNNFIMKKINFKLSNFNNISWILLVFLFAWSCTATQKLGDQGAKDKASSEMAKQEDTAPGAAAEPMVLASSLKTELAPVKHIRYNVYSPEGQANLKIMQRALTKMKNMGCDKPYSWYFQGALHGTPLPDSDGNYPNNYCQGFEISSIKGWNNCTHGSNQNDNPNPPTTISETFHFLSWHKIYLDHFEATIRAVANEPNFTVPYWEYDASDTQNRTLPNLLQNEYRDSSLYEPCRNQGMNNGGQVPIQLWDKTFGNGGSLDSAFQYSSDFSIFSPKLETFPHDYMHGFLGFDTNNSSCPANRITNKIRGPRNGYYSNGLMNDPASAGMDPVFWIHHANIDRLFGKWLIENVDDPVKVRPHYTSQFVQNPWYYHFYTGNDIKDLKVYTFEEAYKEGFGIRDYTYQSFLEDSTYTTEYVRKTNEGIAAELQPRLTASATSFIHISNALASNGDNFTVGQNSPAQIDVRVNQNLDGVTFPDMQNEVWEVEIDVEFTEEPNAIFSVNVTHNGQTESIGSMTFFGSGHGHRPGVTLEEQFVFELRDKHLADLPSDIQVNIKQVANWSGGEAQIIIDGVEIRKRTVVSTN